MTYVISILIIVIWGVVGETLWSEGGYGIELGMFQYPTICLVLAVLIVFAFGMMFLIAAGMDHT
jgi:hypothetical protein